MVVIRDKTFFTAMPNEKVASFNALFVAVNVLFLSGLLPPREY